MSDFDTASGADRGDLQTGLTDVAHAHFPVAVMDAAHGLRGVSVTSPGQVSKALAIALAEAITPQEVSAGIRALMRATRTTKHGIEEDVRAREAGLKLWLAYQVGLPVVRSESVNVQMDAEQSDKIEERFAKSPSLRRKFWDLLAPYADEFRA